MGHFSFFLELAFSAEQEARTVHRVLSPELNAGYSRRSETKLSFKKNMLAINIIAQDLVALRATVNGVLKKIILIQSLMEAF